MEVESETKKKEILLILNNKFTNGPEVYDLYKDNLEILKEMAKDGQIIISESSIKPVNVYL